MHWTLSDIMCFNAETLKQASADADYVKTPKISLINWLIGLQALHTVTNKRHEKMKFQIRTLQICNRNMGYVSKKRFWKDSLKVLGTERRVETVPQHILDIF